MDIALPAFIPARKAARLAKAPFAETVLVCGKCAKKLPGGPKGVRGALKKALKGRRWGKVRVVETRCFDLCPKRRQVLASGRTLAEHRLVVVEPGFDPEAALTQLLGAPDGDGDVRHRKSAGPKSADLDETAGLDETNVELADLRQP